MYKQSVLSIANVDLLVTVFSDALKRDAFNTTKRPNKEFRQSGTIIEKKKQELEQTHTNTHIHTQLCRVGGISQTESNCQNADIDTI